MRKFDQRLFIIPANSVQETFIVPSDQGPVNLTVTPTVKIYNTFTDGSGTFIGFEYFENGTLKEEINITTPPYLTPLEMSGVLSAAGEINYGYLIDPASPGASAYNAEGFNSYGYHQDTGSILNTAGYDAAEYNKDGFKSTGVHINGTSYSNDGYAINGYDSNGYNADGFNAQGYTSTGSLFNSEGYNAQGYNVEGYNLIGFNSAGNHINGTGYDDFGFDNAGYNAAGFDKWGYNTAGYNSDGYDFFGYNNSGYNLRGFNRQGLTASGSAYDIQGYNAQGYNAQGYNSLGFNSAGIHLNGTKYDNNGYDVLGYDLSGYDSNGYDPLGFDASGYTASGSPYNAQGYDIKGFNADGYNSGGFLYNAYGFNAAGKTAVGASFNVMGFNANGFNKHGFNAWGYTRSGSLYNWSGFNVSGNTADGSAYSSGYDFNGFNNTGVHMNGTLYDHSGFNVYGYNDKGFDNRGYTVNNNIYNEYGFDYSGTNYNGTLRDEYGFDFNGINQAGYTREQLSGPYGDFITADNFFAAVPGGGLEPAMWAYNPYYNLPSTDMPYLYLGPSLFDFSVYADDPSPQIQTWLNYRAGSSPVLTNTDDPDADLLINGMLQALNDNWSSRTAFKAFETEPENPVPTMKELEEIVDHLLYDSPNGGNWTSESGIYYFQSQLEAFQAGAAHLEASNSWNKHGFAASYASAVATFNDAHIPGNNGEDFAKQRYLTIGSGAGVNPTVFADGGGSNDEVIAQAIRDARLGRKKVEGLVEVYIWKKTSSKDVGHTAIRIGDKVYGYYPTDLDGDGAYTFNDLRNSEGQMHINSINEFNQIYKGDIITSFTLDVNENQTNALLNNLNSIANQPGIYSLSGRQCTTVAYDCLSKANITFWGFGARTPDAFKQVLSDPFNRWWGPVESSKTFTIR